MDHPAITRELNAALADLRFASPVAYVYNPLDYARAPHRLYLERYAHGGAEVLLIGMNPGPWGMAQTGVPFGAVSRVRDFLGIEAAVGKPPHEHPKRPVTGFACRREEVSGARLWGWAQEQFGTPERFFARFFVGNYCPLLFLDEAGRNLTPDRLPAAELQPLTAACDRALRRTVERLGVRRVVGVGGWAEARAKEAVGEIGVKIGRVLHPSPANPRANSGWSTAATAQLRALGIAL